MDMSIEEMKASDWNEVSSIYRDGIASGNATFETEVPPWDDWDRAHLPRCRIVGRRGGRVIGWAALSPVSERCVYGGVAEVSVYVGEGARGSGAGRALMEELIRRSEDAGIWTLQAGIFPENTASIRLMEAVGFRRIGIRERLGESGGVWRDVILLERRSKTVGLTVKS